MSWTVISVGRLDGFGETSERKEMRSAEVRGKERRSAIKMDNSWSEIDTNKLSSSFSGTRELSMIACTQP